MYGEPTLGPVQVAPRATAARGTRKSEGGEKGRQKEARETR